MSLHARESSMCPTGGVPRLCVLLGGLVVGCGEADELARLDGHWRERYEGSVAEATPDEEVLGRDNVDDYTWFELDLTDGRGHVISTFKDTLDGVTTRCVVRHPITFSHTAAGWTVVEEDGELVEFSGGSDSAACEGSKDFGIWTHGGLAQPLHRVAVIRDALLVESEIDSDGWVFTMVFTRQ